jgi:hypothetical protein
LRSPLATKIAGRADDETRAGVDLQSTKGGYGQLMGIKTRSPDFRFRNAWGDVAPAWLRSA